MRVAVIIEQVGDPEQPLGLKEVVVLPWDAQPTTFNQKAARAHYYKLITKHLEGASPRKIQQAIDLAIEADYDYQEDNEYRLTMHVVRVEEHE